MNWQIRLGSAADAAACHAIYVDAVRNGTAPLYTPEQARAWAPSDTLEDWMPPRLAAGVTWVAEDSGDAAGFLTVTPEGHLDFFFVRPPWHGSGIAAALYGEMSGWAATRGLSHMTTFASHLCRRFLEPRGWEVIAGETVQRNGQELERWKMEWHAPQARSA
ncbi:GNAT family N-acetyltransferase [Tropicimonas marinistellae]|uniref:GNAT family N-acetyltransferase n=1 Tax=Tropicimonas marinistellae TaxID=1739787 RepID=UPI000830827B|nr:GNAT family N-acetyltransferase [Tropicimonas marinistellae]